MNHESAATARTISAEEFVRLPDRGGRLELVRGEVRRMSPGGGRHGRVISRVNAHLSQHVDASGLGVTFAGDTGFRIARNPDTIRAPDVAFVRFGREAADATPQGFIDGAPDLAVEVVSPGDTFPEVEAKVGEWLAGGCRMVWIVNPPGRTVTVYRSLREVAVLNESDTLDGADVLPGFRIAVSALFV